MDDAPAFDPTEDAIRVRGPIKAPEEERPKKRTGRAEARRSTGAPKVEAKPAPIASGGSGQPGSSRDPPIPIPGVGGGGGPAPPPGPAGEPAPVEEDDGDDRIVVGGRVAEPVPKRRKLGREWKPALRGASMQYADFKKPDGKQYRNYIIRCIHHTNCSKTVGRVAKQMQNHSELKPLTIAHAWLDTDWSTVSKHSLANPETEEVDAFLNGNMDDLDQLFHSLVQSP